ncbi:MAG: hypothetical protein IPI35_01275 [Deltaproteobacteria bacterium]|nr:hypothetical protein [Deltaproteobacteria bacterium]
MAQEAQGADQRHPGGQGGVLGAMREGLGPGVGGVRLTPAGVTLQGLAQRQPAVVLFAAAAHRAGLGQGVLEA